MPTDLIITPAEAHDAGVLAALEKECFSEPWHESALLDAMASEDYICLKAVCAGTIAGYALFQNICAEGYVCSIAVFAEMRQKGIGRALLRAMKEYTDKNLQFLTLEVRPSNTPAIALYESEGFLPAGRRKNFYRKPTEDALLMTYTPPQCEKCDGKTD